MTFEAEYIDRTLHDHAPFVTAIWCVLNGHYRRFTVDNVADSVTAGHRFFVRDRRGGSFDIEVRHGRREPHLRVESNESGDDLLCNLPDW